MKANIVLRPGDGIGPEVVDETRQVLDVVARRDAAGHVHDVFVNEAPHHLRDGVVLADVREKLIAETLTLRSTRH